MEQPIHSQVQVLRRGPRAGGWRLVTLRHGDVYRVAWESFSRLSYLVIGASVSRPTDAGPAPWAEMAWGSVVRGGGYKLDDIGAYWHDASNAADAFDRIAAALSTPTTKEPTDENR